MSKSSSKLEPTKFGAYVLLRVLGEGGGGTAYLAVRADNSGPPLVLKILGSAAIDSVVGQERFDHEARLALTADIDAVPKIYDLGRVDEVPYIAMELVRGMSLNRLLQRLWVEERQLDAQAAVSITRSLLIGLRNLHDAKDHDGRRLDAIHRDLSPKNLMVEPGGRVRILDLGIGRSNLRGVRTQTGVILGTPGYMSPEQVLSATLTQASDVYATGVIFWELLVGRRYIPRGELAEVLAATVKRVFEAPSTLRSDVSSQIDDVCSRALAINPERRFASAAEMIAAIDALPDPSVRPSTASPLADVYALDFTDDELPEPSTHQGLPEDGLATIGETQMNVVSTSSVAPDVVALTPPTGVQSSVRVLMLFAIVVAAALLLGVLRQEAATPDVPLSTPPIAQEVEVAPAPGARALSVEPPSTERLTPTSISEEPSKAPIKRQPARDPVESAPPQEEPTAAQLVATFHQRANALKAERPDVKPKIDELLNAVVFESTSVDDADSRARLRKILAELAKLKASEGRSATPPDR